MLSCQLQIIRLLSVLTLVSNSMMRRFLNRLCFPSWFQIAPQIQHLPRCIQRPIMAAAYAIGLPSSILVFVIMQFFAIIVGLFHRKLKTARSRHYYSVAFGSFFLFFTFGWSCLHMFILATIVYLLIPFLPLDKINQVVFLVSMSYLSTCHIWNMWHAFGRCPIIR